MLAAGWVRCRRSAAARTLPSRAICTNTSSWRGLMLIISLLYILDQIFQVFFMDNGTDNGGVPGVPHERPIHRRHHPSDPAQPRPGPAAGRGNRPARAVAGSLGAVDRRAGIRHRARIIVRNAFAPDARFTPGIQFGSKQVLQWSIIALGFGLSLTQVAKTGLESLWVTLITM